jgi:hypothetical protein
VTSQHGAAVGWRHGGTVRCARALENCDLTDLKVDIKKLTDLFVASLQSGKITPQMGFAVASTMASSLSSIVAFRGLPPHLVATTGIVEPLLTIRAVKEWTSGDPIPDPDSPSSSNLIEGP